MLLTISFPIADYRPFQNTDTFTIDMFNNLRFDYGEGFLRSFGGFNERCNLKCYVPSEEKTYAKADHGIRFCRQRNANFNKKTANFDCVFRRVFFGQFSARFDIGLTNRNIVKYWYNLSDIEETTKKLLQMGVYSPIQTNKSDNSLNGKTSTMQNFGMELKKAYFYATTAKPKENLEKVKKNWLSNRCPAIVVQCTYNDLVDTDVIIKSDGEGLLYGFSKIALPEEWNICLLYKEVNGAIPLWVIITGHNANRERLRSLRIWLLKWHQEKETLLSSIYFINSKSKSSNSNDIDIPTFSTCLEQLFDHLSKKKQDGFPAESIVNTMVGIDRQMDPISEKVFMEFIEQHNETKLMLKRANAAMKNNFPFKKVDISKKQPIVFISHTSPDDAQEKWVRAFAAELESRGLTSILDLNNFPFGVPLSEFMEQGLTFCDFVFCICTPAYKEKADARQKGVGYETSIITEQLYECHQSRRYQLIMPFGEIESTTPIWAKGKKALGLDGGNFHTQKFDELIEDTFDYYRGNIV